SAESPSEHPLGKAIVGAAGHRGLQVLRPEEFSSSPAVGVKATVEGSEVKVGGPNLLEQSRLDELPVAGNWRREGAIILHVIVDGQVAGALRLADEIRTESRDAVKALHALDVQV